MSNDDLQARDATNTLLKRQISKCDFYTFENKEELVGFGEGQRETHISPLNVSLLTRHDCCRILDGWGKERLLYPFRVIVG
jgi:hypothetical protein